MSLSIVFLSNYYNHHQAPLCDAFLSMPNVNFTFIATQEVPEERVAMGYLSNFGGKRFYKEAITEKEKKVAEEICFNSDVVIFGSAPISFVMRRLRVKKITFNYSERWFKKGFLKHPGDVFRALKNFTRFNNENFYQLCASAYTAHDSNKVFAFPNRKFRWGYFPEVKNYADINEVIESKQNNSIVWVARFLQLKHPEIVIKLAKRLKKDGYNFEIKMIGNGELLDDITKMVKDENLQENIKILGAMKPEQVREYMEKSEIHIFTSDRNEGWGAVLNEAMNSGCACVASHAIGSVPYLIEDSENGIVYKDGDFEDFYIKVKSLLDNPKKRTKIGKKAYETMINEWNSSVAAERFYKFCVAKLTGKLLPTYFNGPMSLDCGKKKHAGK